MGRNRNGYPGILWSRGSEEGAVEVRMVCLSVCLSLLAENKVDKDWQ